eukprot:CCRYP_003244-RA/>CCRYP_003244-RA protein AED:0.51 eAED:0.71 QI:0/0/0/1/0/0/2/0/100
MPHPFPSATPLPLSPSSTTKHWHWHSHALHATVMNGMNSSSLESTNQTNIWACLRNLDSFQIQHVDAIAGLEAYTGKVVASQRHGMMTVIIGDFTGNLNT